ncbi:MAG: outer membrane protein assembly factor BamD [Dissulfurimicrobium sp.]|uniref:outer membrane protein assembly factor BamD n=1 Tax=Dissulfurimicrobium sp. TaxID=2022436 RepID=UPI00404A2AD2
MKKTTALTYWFSIAIILSFSIGLLSSCSKGIFTRKAGTTAEEMPFSSLYPTSKSKGENEVSMTMEAMTYYNKGLYSMASERFQRIKDQYPFSPYATLAELHIADCKFYENEYEEAISLYEEFEKLHPNNEAIPYVIYQKGRCYHRLMSTPDRDQTNTRKLIETYGRLLNRYPDSPYSFEAKRRLAEAREMLAEHELIVSHWYIRTKQYAQAKMRLERAIELYPDTAAGRKARNILNGIANLGDDTTRSADGQAPKSWVKRLFSF